MLPVFYSHQQYIYICINDTRRASRHWQLRFYIGESARAKHGPELLAACAESRSMGTKPWDNAHLKKLSGHGLASLQQVSDIILRDRFRIWELVSAFS